MAHTLSATDLILNQDGSIYHLNLLPHDIASTIITVGDPDRVTEVSKYFDRIELKKGKREFITHTGYIGKSRISVVSTGIGTDNIDIVMNELDALVNIDLDTRSEKENVTTLNFIRIGTSGAIQPDLPMGSLLASSHGIGLDNLMHYYQCGDRQVDSGLTAYVNNYFKSDNLIPYIEACSSDLYSKIAFDIPTGITLTAPGFYAPQGRNTRAKQVYNNLLTKMLDFHYKGQVITNLEMETAGIYGLANALGHRALSINAILASRVNFEFSKQPNKIVEQAIQQVLERVVMLDE
ncbi:nucleoside phosphorylase [Olivibacter domesticus]|uniref:Uridine phosphorylase n=1 Tax=Olivibacter domesticus TaxID=407022 RepID=A0A1H7I517_OLID1|nr:nucleoside phosphorylase [Olivibacter domesticus]SEK55635.1 uridine phosphorylase [Olivibacter domesticus]